MKQPMRQSQASSDLPPQ